MLFKVRDHARTVPVSRCATLCVVTPDPVRFCRVMPRHGTGRYGTVLVRYARTMPQTTGKTSYNSSTALDKSFLGTTVGEGNKFHHDYTILYYNIIYNTVI